jgi:uncharacterized repeat protein (TIGR03943 family)
MAIKAMTARPNINPPPRRSSNFLWLLWLDALAIGTWGVLLLKYWLTGKLNLLLHPDYMWLAVGAGGVLLVLAAWKTRQGIQAIVRRNLRPPMPNIQHFTLFPPGWSSALLLAVAVFGLQFSPQPFSSDMAIDRGVIDTLSMTRSKPQAFRASVNSDQRSIVDWVRTLSVYPEPDAYTGQKVNVQGFVIQPSTLPDNYLMISRFILTCCAADAYPVGLPVKLRGSRAVYQPDTWLQVKGSMITETLNEQRQLVIQASELEAIAEPKNPYDY